MTWLTLCASLALAEPAGRIDYGSLAHGSPGVISADTRDGWLLTTSPRGRRVRLLDGTREVDLPRTADRGSVLLADGETAGLEGEEVVLRTAAGVVIARLPLPTGTDGTLTASPDGRWILVRTNRSVGRVDHGGGMAWKHTTEHDEWATIDPTGRRVVVREGVEIVEIDAASGEVLRRTSASGLHTRPIWHDGALLLTRDQALWMWDGTTLRSCVGAPTLVAAARDLLVDEAGVLWRLPACGQAPERVGSLPGAGYSQIVGFLPAPNRGFLVVYACGAVLSLAADRAPPRMLPLLGEPTALALDQDGDTLVVYLRSGDVLLFDLAAQTSRFVDLDRPAFGLVRLSPDGKRLYLSGRTDVGSPTSTDLLVDVRSGVVRDLARADRPGAFGPDGRLYLPDGDRVVADDGTLVGASAGCTLRTIAFDDSALLGTCDQDQRVLRLDGATAGVVAYLPTTLAPSLMDLPGAGNFLGIAGHTPTLFAGGARTSVASEYATFDTKDFAGSVAGVLTKRASAPAHDTRGVVRLPDAKPLDIGPATVLEIATSRDGERLAVADVDGITLYRVRDLAP